MKKLFLGLVFAIGLLLSANQIFAPSLRGSLDQVRRDITALESRAIQKASEIVGVEEMGEEHQDMVKRMSLTLADQLERWAGLLRLKVELLDKIEAE